MNQICLRMDDFRKACLRLFDDEQRDTICPHGRIESGHVLDDVLAPHPLRAVLTLHHAKRREHRTTEALVAAHNSGLDTIYLTTDSRAASHAKYLLLREVKRAENVLCTVPFNLQSFRSRHWEYAIVDNADYIKPELLASTLDELALHQLKHLVLITEQR